MPVTTLEYSFCIILLLCLGSGKAPKLGILIKHAPNLPLFVFEYHARGDANQDDKKY